MKRLTLTALVFAALFITGGSVGASGSPDGLSPAGADAGVSAQKECAYEWRRKRIVRWVRRNGRLKRVVRFKRVRVRVCRNVPGPAPNRLGVKAWEFGFTLSAKQVSAGDTIIELNNQGEDAHDLHVKRLDGGDELSAPETEPGWQNRIRLTTAPGDYRLWCSLPNHASWGMDTTFTAD